MERHYVDASVYFFVRENMFKEEFRDWTIIKPFSTNVPFRGKPGSWFLLANFLENTCGRVTF